MSIEFYEDLKTHLANVQSSGKSSYFSSKASILTFHGVVVKETREGAEAAVRSMRDEGNTVSTLGFVDRASSYFICANYHLPLNNQQSCFPHNCLPCLSAAIEEVCGDSS